MFLSISLLPKSQQWQGQKPGAGELVQVSPGGWQESNSLKPSVLPLRVCLRRSWIQEPARTEHKPCCLMWDVHSLTSGPSAYMLLDLHLNSIYPQTFWYFLRSTWILQSCRSLTCSYIIILLYYILLFNNKILYTYICGAAVHKLDIMSLLRTKLFSNESSSSSAFG